MQDVCIICGKSDDASSMIRISKAASGKIRINAENFQNGAKIEPRGGLKPPGGMDTMIVICRDAVCISRARQDRLIESRFDVPAGDVYLKLAGMIPASPADKLESLIGLGIRSRKIALGSTGVELTVKSGKVGLILISSDTQRHTREKLETLAHKHHIPILQWFGSKSFEDIVNKLNCRIAGVMDTGLVEEIMRLFASEYFLRESGE